MKRVHVDLLGYWLYLVNATMPEVDNHIVYVDLLGYWLYLVNTTMPEVDNHIDLLQAITRQ